jgi:hypothetical protein
MSNLVVLIACYALLLAAILLALLAVSYHRVIVVDRRSGMPIPGALVSLERASGSCEEIGRTDASGRLTFWNSPLPLPQLICARSRLHPPACVSAISLGVQRIELGVLVP